MFAALLTPFQGIRKEVAMNARRRTAWTKPIARAACLVAVALSLGGCVVYPAYGPHWHPWGYYR